MSYISVINMTIFYEDFLLINNKIQNSTKKIILHPENYHTKYINIYVTTNFNILLILILLLLF